MEDYAIGIDIGGTKISAALINKKGHVHLKKIYDTPKASKHSTLHLLRNIVETYTVKASEQHITLAGIGIGSAGQIHVKKGIVLSGTKNIQDWSHVPVRDYLSTYTDLPIYLDNDVNTLTLAEYHLGIGKGIKDLLCLSVGTGIGGGVISNGMLIRGEWGGATELGHITVNMYGPQCNCGSRGCLESYASGNGIANRLKDQILCLPEESLTELGLKKNGKITSKLAFDLYNKDIDIARIVIEDAIHALAFSIVSLIHTFNPSIVVLGGGVFEKQDWILAAIQEKVKNIGMESLVSPVRIERSSLGYDASLVGAALQAWVAHDLGFSK